MKVLVVLGVPPLVEGQAQGRTSIGLIRGLQAHGVDVSAIAARRQESSAGPPPADIPVRVVDVSEPPRGWRSRRSMVTRPFGRLGEGPFAEEVVEAAGRVDVVHLEEVSTAPLATRLRTPSLVHLHYLVERDRPMPPPWSKDILGYVELVRAERRATRATRWFSASSPVVAEYVRRRAASSDVTLAPLSLDPHDYPAAAHDHPPVAGLIGSAAWPPTRSAIDRLLRSVWPLIHTSLPHARLRIAGRALAQLELVAPAGVELLGEVAEAAPFLAGLSVLLYPVARGSGMKVKVLEALACGVPVVTTPDGAEGIGAHDGVVVETDDARLAAATVELLEDLDAARQRGEAARRLFLERFSPRPATLPLLDAYERMVGR